MAMKRNVQAATQADEAAAQAQNAEAAATETPVEVETPKAGKPAAATTAVAKATTTAVAAPRKQLVRLYDDLQDVFVAEYGVLPKLKTTNGNVQDSDNKLLGDHINIQILSWNKQYVVGPCANSAPAELVKYSYDREAFADGSGLLDDYVAELKADNWNNAAVKEYYEIVCVLTGSAKPSDLIGEMVQLQLSPTSVKDFEGYRLQTAFKIARGLLPEDAAANVTVSAEVVTAKGNTWTKMNFKPQAMA